MKTYPTWIASPWLPGFLLFLLIGLVSIACSNSQTGSTQKPKATVNAAGNQGSKTQTPLAGNKVYSPIVGSAGTPGVTPNVKITVNPVTLKAGSLITVTATIENIAAPTYLLYVRDAGVTNVAKAIGVTDENIMLPDTGTSQVLQVVSAHGSSTQAVFLLRALQAGTTEVWVSAVTAGETAGVSAGWVSETVKVKVEK